LVKLPLKEAKPATNAPIKAVKIINNIGLSAFKISKDILCVNKKSFLKLIVYIITPQKKNNAKNPDKNAFQGVSGIKAGTKKAEIAILHQGKKSPKLKANNAILIVLAKNFIPNNVLFTKM
jgi:hypothetical protein